MRNTLLTLALLLTSSLALAASTNMPGRSGTPSDLRILEAGVLCYTSVFEINGEAIDPLVDIIEDAMAEKLGDMGLGGRALGLEVLREHQGDGCTTELLFNFRLDQREGVNLFVGDLELVTDTAVDQASKLPLRSAVAWRRSSWGGSNAVLTPEKMIAEMNRQLRALLAQFAADYQARR